MADVVGFLVDNKEKAADAVAGAILRIPEEGRTGQDLAAAETEYLLHLFFLDSEGRPLITGREPRRSYLAGRIDVELAQAFGANNIVIFN
jgi:hypothetical protein